MQRSIMAGTIVVAMVMGLMALGPAAVSAQQAVGDAAAGEQTPAATETTNSTAQSSALALGEEPAQAGDLEEALKKVKNPVPWFSWGGDLRLREVWGTNWTTLDSNAPSHERHFERYLSRLWGTLTPVKDVDVNVRMVWEPRVLQRGPQPNDGVNSRYIWDEVIFDRLNLSLHRIGGSGLSATIGRQDLILGNGWLVLDGTPLDGSRTIYFDAVRLTYEAEPIKTSFDAMYIDQNHTGDRIMTAMNRTGQDVMEQDERGAIFYVTNRSLEKTQIDGYYIYKHDKRQKPTGNDADIHAIGGRATGELTDHWMYYLEGAHEWGEKNDDYLSAYGFNSKLSYLCKDKLNNQFRIAYEFLSGDDPSSSANEAFDPLWGRWPQWSELYAYTIAMESGRPGEQTNLHRLAGGWSISPAKNLEWCNDYHLLFADENTLRNVPGFTNGGAFRGQLLTSVLKYKFNEHVSTHLWTEFFFPGNFYTSDRNDPAVFVRYELCFTF
ncbi:MAG: alginate export family protein [Phycisphaerae bacterium]|nr:alginate export family protein [Phycisphaerae bacterium]